MEIFHDICPKEAYSKLILINFKLQIFDVFDIIVIVFLLKVVKYVLKLFPLNKLDYLMHLEITEKKLFQSLETLFSF